MFTLFSAYLLHALWWAGFLQLILSGSDVVFNTDAHASKTLDSILKQHADDVAEVSFRLSSSIEVLETKVFDEMTQRLNVLDDSLAGLKTAIDDEVSVKIKAVADAQAELKQDLEATVTGKIVDISSDLTSFKTIETAHYKECKDELATQKKSIKALEDAAKCNFRGTYSTTTKKCKCNAQLGFEGDTCDEVIVSTCKDVKAKGENSDKMYTFTRGGKAVKVFCLNSNSYGKGGWELYTMFGTKGEFTAAQALPKVWMKSQNMPTSPSSGIDRHMKTFGLGWSNTADSFSGRGGGGYCGSGAATRFDFHDSGPNVGTVSLKLPSGYSEYMTKFGNCYGGCRVDLLLGNSRKSYQNSCGNRATCHKIAHGAYSSGQSLTWKELAGTCVGSILWVAVQ
jgi:hypothetical protein